MRRSATRRSHKAGLPPGSPVHIGERKSETVEFELIHYDEATFVRRRLAGLEEVRPYLDSPGVTWLHVTGVHDAERLNGLETLGLHPLVVEDILNTEQRTKHEDYGQYLYIVLKMLNREEGAVATEQVSIVLGKNYVVSVEESPSGAFASVQSLLEKDRGRIRQAGPDYLAYMLLDRVVDNYFIVLEWMSDRIEETQDRLIADATADVVRSLHERRRDILLMRRSIWPLREALGSLVRERSALISEHTGLYLRDVYDHTIHVGETLESFHETQAGMLEIYVSSSANRLNEVIKVLTVIATVFIPPTFIASVYGMNFRYMPELDWRWGYPAAWAAMIGVGVAMLVFLKRRRWL